MNIKPIRNAEDYQFALKEIDRLIAVETESPEGDYLDVLATLVEAYEARHFPMEFADPVEVIKFRMDQKGLAPKDLVPMIGRLNRVYEILAGKRTLTLAMIWRLHEGLGIPVEMLIRPLHRTAAAA
ncbi:MAG: transcriptional regulator [Pseudomonadota bacterium]